MIKELKEIDIITHDQFCKMISEFQHNVKKHIDKINKQVNGLNNRLNLIENKIYKK